MLVNPISAMLLVLSECEDVVAAVDCHENDDMKRQLRWVDMMSRAAATTKMAKYTPKSEEYLRKEQNLLNVKYSGMTKEVLINKIQSTDPNEAAKLKLTEKNKQQLKAILMDVTMRQKREEDAELAKGWAANVADIRRSFDSMGVETDDPAKDEDGGDGKGSGSPTKRAAEKPSKHSVLCPSFFISGTDNEHEPKVVAATLTVEIFKNSWELQQGCEHFCRGHVSKVVKFFVKHDAKVRLPFVGEVVPLCRARAATISVGQALKSKLFYHVAKSFWRTQ